MLCKGVVAEVLLYYDSPQMDMFAILLNNQLPIFVSPVPNPLALEYNALRVVGRDWTSTLSLLQSVAGCSPKWFNDLAE